MLHVKVGDIMSEHVITIPETATVAQAAHILLRFRINGVLIVSSEDKNRVLGIVSTTHLMKLLDRALSKHGHREAALDKLADMPALDVADKNIVTATRDERVARLIPIMQKNDVFTIPVYEGDILAGVVGGHDIFNVAFSK